MAPRTSRKDGQRDGSNPSGPTRRRLLGALGAGTLTGLGGCIGGVLGRPRTDGGRTIRRSVTVTFDGTSTPVRYGIPAAAYRAARDRNAAVPDAAAAARTADVLDDLAARLRERAGSPAAGVRAAQSLTASLPYATDAASTGDREYIRHPTETLVDGEGDCDDKAVLLSALLSRPAFGYRTGLVMPREHCATLVARDDLPAGLVASAPLSVRLAGTEFVYVEAVGRVPPGDWAKAYGERPILAAYRNRWHVVDGGALLDTALTALDGGSSGIVTSYL
jgi:hypothetical protein